MNTKQSLTARDRVKLLERELRETREENRRLKSRPGKGVKDSKKIRLGLITALILVVASVTVFLLLQPTDPVPYSIRHSVKFDVYYPKDTVKKGQRFNASEFSIQDNGAALTFAVGVPGGPNLVISEQPKPTQGELALFYKTRMPVTIPINTPAGTAQLGGLNKETFVSLPTNTNTWVIATAPLGANQAKIQKILSTMTLAR